MFWLVWGSFKTSFVIFKILLCLIFIFLVCLPAHTGRPEANLQEFVLSFYTEGLRGVQFRSSGSVGAGTFTHGTSCQPYFILPLFQECVGERRREGKRERD